MCDGKLAPWGRGVSGAAQGVSQCFHVRVFGFLVVLGPSLQVFSSSFKIISVCVESLDFGLSSGGLDPLSTRLDRNHFPCRAVQHSQMNRVPRNGML